MLKCPRAKPAALRRLGVGAVDHGAGFFIFGGWSRLMMSVVAVGEAGLRDSLEIAGDFSEADFEQRIRLGT
jgi:hypothetical protein